MKVVEKPRDDHVSDSGVEAIRPIADQTNDWPDNFFEETYGAFADQPIERGSQGEFETREVLH